MKRFNVIFSLILAGLLAFMPVAVLAQQSSPGAAVTQTGSTGLAASTCLQVSGTNSASQALTIPAPGGANSVYIDYLVLAIYANAAVATSATVQAYTSTNIAGTPSWPITSGAGAGGNLGTTGGVAVAVGASGPLAIPIKALAGVGPVISSPAAATGAVHMMTACWHVAP